MRLYLFRHGIAAQASKGQRDAARPLTEEGARQTQAAARGLARLIEPPEQPELILTSPRLRAVQTAEIVGRVFDRKPEIAEELGVDELTPIIRRLRACRESTVLAVGHEPTLGRLTQLLVTGSADPCGIELKKAGCACLEVSWGHGDQACEATLLWLATPAMLRAIKQA